MSLVYLPQWKIYVSESEASIHPKITQQEIVTLGIERRNHFISPTSTSFSRPKRRWHGRTLNHTVITAKAGKHKADRSRHQTGKKHFHRSYLNTQTTGCACFQEIPGSSATSMCQALYQVDRLFKTDVLHRVNTARPSEKKLVR